MNYTFQLGVALDQLPALLDGALVTLALALLGFWGGALIGVVCAAAKTFGGPVARGVAQSYVTFFTNTPALLQIYFFYFGLPEAGILLSSFVSVLLGLTLNAGAYLTEIMRAGFVSVRRTELEAAEALGFSLPQQIRFVVLPHLAKTIYPALANFFIILVLGTSMAAVFGVDELTGTAINISTENYRWIEMFTIVAAIYIVLTFLASLLLAAVGWWGFRVRAKVF
ncbi:MAG: amino acid ABC transporter permease [Geminicoccaceae bacterium]